MFGIFIGYVLLSVVCSVIGATLVALLLFKHEDPDAKLYDNTINHSAF